MIRRLIFGLTLLVVLVGAVLFYKSVVLSSRRGTDVAVYSVRRYDPHGTAALRDLLLERGVQIRTLESPNLRASDHGVLIQTLPFPGPRRARYEVPVQRLMDWIADGNTVIQLTRSPTELMTRVKINPSTAPSDEDARRKAQDLEEQGASPDSAPGLAVMGYLESSQEAPTGSSRVAPLVLWSPMVFDDVQSESWKPIARTARDSGKVVAGQMNIGRGKLVVVGAPTPALNGSLGEQGNLHFLLSQIGNGPVIFDEWSHGIGHEATIIGFIHDVGLVPLLLQILFIAAIYVWSTSGYPRRDDSQRPRQRSSIEQMQTLGFLYSRSFNSDVTFNYVNAEVMRRIAGAMRCRPREVMGRVKTLKPQLRAKCEDLFGRLTELRPAHGVRCVSCGYELYLLASDRCPECGASLAPETLQRILEASRGVPPGTTDRRRSRFDSGFANVLTLSHQLSQEVERDRSALR